MGLISKKDVIRRICEAKVGFCELYNYTYPCDCFCDESDMLEKSYMMDERFVIYIENAIKKEIKKHSRKLKFKRFFKFLSKELK